MRSEQFVKMKDGYWEHVFGKTGASRTVNRGCWILFISPEDKDVARSVIADLTTAGRLDYMASIAPGPMSGG